MKMEIFKFSKLIWYEFSNSDDIKSGFNILWTKTLWRNDNSIFSNSEKFDLIQSLYDRD
jgi:hypothetical protein